MRYTKLTNNAQQEVNMQHSGLTWYELNQWKSILGSSWDSET